MGEYNQDKERSKEQPHTWWQKNKRIFMLVTLIVLVLLLAFALTVYLFGWDWTGFIGGESKVTKTPLGTSREYSPGKTFWDWMQLLIIPVVLGIAGFWFSQIQKSNEQRTTADNQREAALQAYIDKMSELLLNERPGCEFTSQGELTPKEEEVRKIARVRTLTVLEQLDGRRKRSVLQFLYESDLIGTHKRIVYLKGANLSDANLTEVDLHEVDLRGAKLKRANLDWANLSGCNLSKADLSKATLSVANLVGADLSGAILYESNLSEAYLNDADLSIVDLEKANLDRTNLSKANLRGASVTPEQLGEAGSLRDTTMPDGSIHS